MHEKANKKELYRVGFEEIHKLWSDINYRPAFQFIHRIATAHVPVFGTSGSLPEHLLSTLPSLTCIIWKTIRMPSNRKELIYEIKRVPRGASLSSAVAEYWKQVCPSYREQDRCLVFCRTINQAKVIAELLGVDPHHRECKDNSAVSRFLAGDQKILPTTIKLGCGFHYAHIRDVIHADIAYSIVDQLQEDSRGGRDGLPCRAITFVTEGFPPYKSNHEFDLGADAIYHWSKETKRCLRIPSSLFLDGVPVTCSLIGAQLCANCTAQLKEKPPALARSLPCPKNPPPSETTSLKYSMKQDTPVGIVSRSLSIPNASQPISSHPIEEQTPLRNASQTISLSSGLKRSIEEQAPLGKASQTISLSSGTNRLIEEQTPLGKKRRLMNTFDTPSSVTYG
jgi:hypothetical protein